jgi:hypothetical protein
MKQGIKDRPFLGCLVLLLVYSIWACWIFGLVWGITKVVLFAINN